MNTTATRYAPRQGALQVHNFDNATDNDLLAVAPAIFAEAASPDRTKPTYQFVSTIGLIAAMRQEGWMVTAAGQKYVRDQNRWTHARHFVRLRHETADKTQEFVPEAIIMNAHDGTASWKYFDGAFRFVCANGLVWGQIMGTVKAHHTLRQAGIGGTTALTLSQELMRVLPQKMLIADRLRETQLDEEKTLEYFTRAIAVRYGNAAPPILNSDLMGSPWLKEDFGFTAWQIYNHAQRYLVTRGGIEGRDAAGRVHVSHPVKRVDETVRVNVGLWDEVMKMVPQLEPELRTPVLEPELQ